VGKGVWEISWRITEDAERRWAGAGDGQRGVWDGGAFGAVVDA